MAFQVHQSDQGVQSLNLVGIKALRRVEAHCDDVPKWILVLSAFNIDAHAVNFSLFPALRRVIEQGQEKIKHFRVSLVVGHICSILSCYIIKCDVFAALELT